MGVVIRQGPVQIQPVIRHLPQAIPIKPNRGLVKTPRLVRLAHPEEYGGHCLRASLVTEASANGATDRQIMRQTGHMPRALSGCYSHEERKDRQIAAIRFRWRLRSISLEIPRCSFSHRQIRRGANPWPWRQFVCSAGRSCPLYGPLITKLAPRCEFCK